MKKKDFILLIIIVVILVALFFLDIIEIPCIINKVTGLHCPGCGVTRAILALSKGQVYQAFRYNSIVFIDIPVLLVTGALEYIFKNNEKLKKVNSVILIFLLIITVLYGILRNIPIFSFLAPITL